MPRKTANHLKGPQQVPLGQRPLWGSGFILRESTSGSAPSTGAQSPPLPAVTPAPELRCSLRPKGLYTLFFLRRRHGSRCPISIASWKPERQPRGRGCYFARMACTCARCAAAARRVRCQLGQGRLVRLPGLCPARCRALSAAPGAQHPHS